MRLHFVNSLCVLMVCLDWATTLHATQGVATNDLFSNPIAGGADPWVVRDQKANRYLWCSSDRDLGIALYESPRLTLLGKKKIVWNAPKAGMFSAEVWAPELHLMDGRWHIYFAASNGQNKNHLAYVLCSRTEDPFGEYELSGPLTTGDGPDGKSPNIWAIDMTVLEIAGKRYAIWSGWDAPETDRQFLYIALMKNPTTLAGPRVRICSNADFSWERTEPGPKGRGLNEGPEILKRFGRTFLLYSCGASWLPNYKLGLLELTGTDPLLPQSWRKHAEPVFQGTADTFGVGHSCFVPSPDGKELWHVFHAKREQKPGWNRAIFVQPLTFDQTGFPCLGTPARAGELMKRPSGEGGGLLK